MNNLNFYNNPTLLQRFIWQSIKDLPNESVDEILSYVIYVRKKNMQPELFDTECEILAEELRQNSLKETQHLESEFENYKRDFPHE